jgi:hypothetical protein
MSICINNDLIWVAVPRCASTSIEHALMNSKLNCKYPLNYQKNYYDKGLHLHLEIKKLYNEFGLKESICIKRDWFDRWIASLEYMWSAMVGDDLDPIISWENIDNNWIYENFTKEYIDAIYTIDNVLKINSDIELFKIKDKYSFYFCNVNQHHLSKFYFYPGVLLSQNTWKQNKKCTYEFDFNELDKFENFIENRYGIDFKLSKLNSYKKVSNKIIKDDILRNWVWENFEKRFILSANKII